MSNRISKAVIYWVNGAINPNQSFINRHVTSSIHYNEVHSSAASTEKIYIYRAGNLKKVKHTAEKDEVIKPMVITRAGIKRLAKSGKLTDAKTIAALALCGII